MSTNSLGTILSEFKERLNAIDANVRHLPDDSICTDCNRILPGRPDVDYIIEHRPDIRGPVPRCFCAQKIHEAEQLLHQLADLPRSVRGPRGGAEWGEATLANIVNTPGNAEAVHLIKSFAHGNAPPIVMLIGPPGTGKTHMLEAVGRYYLKRSLSVRYVLVSSMLDSLRPSGDKDPRSDISEFLLPRLLILDDLGVEKASEWVEEKLMAVIDDRYRNNRHLLVASNSTQVEIINRLGPRIADRLYDENSGKVARAVINDASARQSPMFAPVQEEIDNDYHSSYADH